MNDHARELRRYASVLGRPTIMLDAADEIERLAAKLEAAEKSDAESLAMYRKARDERDVYKTAFEEWHQKTGWVQQGINDGSIPPTYLGWHRADVMADMLKSARRDYCVLEGYYTELAEKLAAVNHAVDEAYQRGYATGQEEVAAELEFAKQEIANLHDDISEWMDKCDALLARIREMERQEPVAWLHETRSDYAVVTDDVKRVWEKAVVGALADYSIPLYLAPGAQGEEK